MSETVTPRQVTEAVPGWRVISGALHVMVECGSFPAALDLVHRVGALAEQHNHHPDIDIRYSRVHLSVVSHDVGQLTDRDVRFARAVSTLVDDAGFRTDPAALTVADVAIDAMDVARIRPFWLAVLGYREAGDNEIVDPDRLAPLVWFQQMDQPRTQRNRIHLDVDVPHDEAERRLQAALAAGGRLVTAQYAPAWWVLADAEGNEACICTWQERD
ncbi:VOC family protein [Raineyella sp. W15-4]|uniref:VOC family protein n=1 Tax=Raineyella sp. W15-4 TaxID=3081651 RepID=UPI00295459ED|nr:VOC family protein [Raineyella sp. W15-4]WOQ17352.1 VOC family protein [Raineyella sp. W15-4]